ncbi:MAG: TonB-dependent receptor, partial [Gammaproteobacteria bacterium]|nr:TonB-dependent receptor [Gammaproteobacteria bacterium]
MKPNKNWNTWKSILVLSALACAISPAISPALAEEDADLADEDIGANTIIVTGSRSESNLLDTSDAISVISQEEIDRVKFIDAREELLSRIPGNSKGRNLRWAISSKNYTVNLLDGVMMRPFGKGYTSSINETNSWDIERIEVIRGPASALFGSHAIGGVINVITKEPPLEREINLWTDIGAWGRARGGVSIGNTHDDFGYSVNVNALKLDGFRDRTARKEKAFSSKGVWSISDENKLTVRVEYQDKLTDQPGTLSQEEFDEDWGQATINDAYEDAQFNTLTGTYEHQISDKISTKVTYSGRKTVISGPTALSYKSGYIDDDYRDHNLVLESHWDFTPGASKLVAGADIQRSDVNETSLEWDTNESTTPGDSEKSWDLFADVVSPFAQVQFSPADWAEFTLGVRYDNVTYTGTDLLGTLGKLESKYSNFSTKAGVSFKISESDRLWFSYGEGFMVPSRSRLFTSIATMRRGRWSGYFADPDLKPETAVNYSVGLRGSTNDDAIGYDLT